MPKLSPDTPQISADCEVENSTFGRYCELGRGCRVLNSSFGDYAYADRFADIANTSVGKFANIAAFTRIGPTDHPWRNAAQHHFLYRSRSYFDDEPDWKDFFDQRATRRTTLGADCWIGHGAIIKPEVSIGVGAIVAAGAVVTKDVAPFTIVAGVPATRLRLRFPEDVAQDLLALAWWDWDHARLRDALADFRTLSAAEFVAKHRE
ncbi:chloramphenicol acetyltransferase [uncultured Thioclava sp.]|uniref:chloramphenicol acetyltransferase n=1 Tax=uncultured Thioclava sp. TaxID=473858 RepID=UPI0025DC9BB2|nr:chloramphenicol acetyltransferase [uncultured Thioclava sp.]